MWYTFIDISDDLAIKMGWTSGGMWDDGIDGACMGAVRVD